MWRSARFDFQRNSLIEFCARLVCVSTMLVDILLLAGCCQLSLVCSCDTCVRLFFGLFLCYLHLQVRCSVRHVHVCVCILCLRVCMCCVLVGVGGFQWALCCRCYGKVRGFACGLICSILNGIYVRVFWWLNLSPLNRFRWLRASYTYIHTYTLATDAISRVWHSSSCACSHASHIWCYWCWLLSSAFCLSTYTYTHKYTHTHTWHASAHVRWRRIVLADFRWNVNAILALIQIEFGTKPFNILLFHLRRPCHI